MTNSASSPSPLWAGAAPDPRALAGCSHTATHGQSCWGVPCASAWCFLPVLPSLSTHAGDKTTLGCCRACEKPNRLTSLCRSEVVAVVTTIGHFPCQAVHTQASECGTRSTWVQFCIERWGETLSFPPPLFFSDGMSLPSVQLQDSPGSQGAGQQAATARGPEGTGCPQLPVRPDYIQKRTASHHLTSTLAVAVPYLYK